MHDPFGWLGATVQARYRVDEVVGEGGFGVVYRAFHLGLGEQVALKCLKLPPSLPAVERERFLATFHAEAKLLHRLSRANAGVVQALDVGAAESPCGVWTPFLVLEWLDGVPLDQELQKAGDAPRSMQGAVELLEPAALALAEAHRQGIAHRDIKPANLFLATVAGRRGLKVLDFGIAKVLTETASVTQAMAETGTSIQAFTPQYGAPEQFDRRYGATGPWTDVFALALVLIEVVTGRPALDGQDTIQLMVASANPAKRPTPGARGIQLPAAVEAVLQRAVAVQPRDRFPTAGEFWAALTQALAEVGPTLYALPPVAPTVPLPLPVASTTSPQIATAPRSRRTSSPVVPAVLGIGLVGVVGVLLVGGVSAWLLRSSTKAAIGLPSDSAASGPEPSASGAPSSTPAPQMVAVGPGVFEMGERPEGTFASREVVLSRRYEIDATEVTVSAYRACVQAGQCTASGNDSLCTTAPSLPVTCVTRSQADTYCRFAGKRLPSEAEWEYAARGADGRKFPWGNATPTCDRAAFGDTATGACARGGRGPVPVGSLPSGASLAGALDLAGNVREWVADGWTPNLSGLGKGTNPLVSHDISPSGVVRGGSWISPPGELRATYRAPLDQKTGDPYTGFRCVRGGG